MSMRACVIIGCERIVLEGMRKCQQCWTRRWRECLQGEGRGGGGRSGQVVVMIRQVFIYKD